MHIPPAVFEWTRSDPVRHVDGSTIFDYMDGAGELYLGYRFHGLDVHTYRAKGRPEVQLEIYRMRTSDDAFGLLSLDWGGEPVGTSDAKTAGGAPPVVPGHRALYGSGLVRVWADTLYLRVFTAEETAESKMAVLELARRAALGIPNPPRPALLSFLPQAAGPWSVLPDRTAFFRSRHVLNSIFFVGFENVLRLGHETEAVAAAYGKASGIRIQTFIIRYSDPGRADAAFTRFRDAFCPEAAGKPDSSKLWATDAGWSGCSRLSRFVVLAFDAPDRESCAMLLDAIQEAMQTRQEAGHE